MKIVQIDKENWADGLKKLSKTYRLFGPVKEDDFHNFKELDQGQLPDLSCLNTRLSPKSTAGFKLFKHPPVTQIDHLSPNGSDVRIFSG
jgi:hypothetical protein